MAKYNIWYRDSDRPKGVDARYTAMKGKVCGPDLKADRIGCTKVREHLVWGPNTLRMTRYDVIHRIGIKVG